jgi:hypothetical protein
MTAFLQKNALDLAIAAGTIPFAIYGLHRMFPAPDVAFLAVATTVSVCVGISIRALGSQYANRLTRSYGYVDEIDNKTTNHIFNRLNFIFSITTSILLPIFVRAIGQRMGFQVPGYLQTLGYFNLAGNAFWASKTIFEILRDAHYQGSFITPPARR